MSNATLAFVDDPFFYVAAIPAVLVYGMGKGGLGGAAGVAIGASLLGALPAAGMRLMLGIIAVLFCLDYLVRGRRAKPRSCR